MARSGSLSLASFSAQARGGKSSVVEHTILPDTDSPGVALTEKFDFQSYFDDTLLERAIGIQSKNEPIVATTLKKANVGGYALALHPSSQTPVAIQPVIGGQGGSPQATILMPGQIYRPHGRPNGKPGHFSGFHWGLPFGWLGGGMATLYAFPSPDADVAWPGNAEVIFHRQRARIVAPAALPANARKNWPLRFPWTQALRGSGNIPQQGAGVISIAEPTRVFMTLRLASLAAAATMRILVHESNDFGLDSAGAVIAAEAIFHNYIWGSYVANGGAGNLSTNYPVVELTAPFARLAADDGGICLVDMSASTLTDAYVDIVRYGRL